MGKLLKYEFKGSYRYYLGMYIIITLINIAAWILGRKYQEAIVATFLSLTAFAAYIITIVSVIKSFRDELYENSGYLMFTLPRSGNQILGSKLIVGVIWLFATSIFVALLAFMGVCLINGLPTDIPRINIDSKIMADLILDGIMVILFVLFRTVFLMLMIYFSITISKITLPNGKGGKAIGFLIFVALSVILALINIWLLKVTSLSINIPMNLISGGNTTFIDIGGSSNIAIDAQGLHLNVAALILDIASCVGLFLGTGWLMDNKVDL